VSSFVDLIDLVSQRLGGRAIVANDEFFAPKENLLKPGRAIFIPDKFTEFGKWMDGWESRRRREPGHDWCIIALGRPGAIRGVNVDTGHFKGNQPEACIVEASEIEDDPNSAALTVPGVVWTPVIARTVLKPDSEHLIDVLPEAKGRRFTHVRLNIYPDGGVARLRVHGQVLPDWKALAGQEIDLAAAENAGLVIAANDMHFGSRHNLIMPGRAVNMGDGWETRRRRGPLDGRCDWCIVRLGHRGVIRRVEVDTNHFKGNFPESCLIEVCDAPAGMLEIDAAFDGGAGAVKWSVLLPRTKLKADTRHYFETELENAGAASTHARLSIFPDGGVSRLRMWGTVSKEKGS